MKLEDPEDDKQLKRKNDEEDDEDMQSNHKKIGKRTKRYEL